LYRSILLNVLHILGMSRNRPFDILKLIQLISQLEETLNKTNSHNLLNRCIYLFYIYRYKCSSQTNIYIWYTFKIGRYFKGLQNNYERRLSIHQFSKLIVHVR